MASNTGIAVAVLILATFALGAGVEYMAGGNSGSGVATTVTSANSSTPYVLTLMISTNNLYNSTVGDQPAYFVVGPQGLESSANITLPANSLIEVVITNFDDGNASLASPQYANVTGTQGNTISVYNNDVLNSSQGANGIVINGTQTVSSVPESLISHTFTIPQLGVNIPVELQSTVVAYFRTGAAGSYLWLCESACGSGANGEGGAMSTPGWMTGTLTVG